VTRRGALNAWKCPNCGGLTVVVHVDDGVTPMFLACRRTDGCTGMAVSSGYPSTPAPADVAALLAWEWFRPTGRALRELSDEMRDHVARGGLDLRPLTDAGRQAFAEGV
jgi:hypothetical protein